MNIIFVFFFKCAIKKDKFQVCMSVLQSYGIKNTKFIVINLSQSSYKLGYWNDLLLFIDYENYTFAWQVCKVTSWDFRTLLPSIQSGDDIFFQYLNLYKRKRLGHFLFFILSSYYFVTRRFSMYVLNWLWNKYCVLT